MRGSIRKAALFAAASFAMAGLAPPAQAVVPTYDDQAGACAAAGGTRVYASATQVTRTQVSVYTSPTAQWVCIQEDALAHGYRVTIPLSDA